MHKSCGFSIIELLIVLVIMGIVSSLAVLGYRHHAKNNQVDHYLTRLLAAIEYARSSAIEHNAIVTFCRSADRQSCSGQWQEGQLVFIDYHGNRQVDSHDRILRVCSAYPGADLSWRGFGSQSALQFAPNGYLLGNQVGRFILTTPGKIFHIIINTAGRVRVMRYDNTGGVYAS